MIKQTVKDAEARMKGAILSLEEDLSGIRTGRATPGLVEKLPIDYYGAPTALKQLASISVPDPRTLLIKPFDRTTMKAIEKEIIASNLGLTPNNDGQSIRLNLPPLTEERRRDLVNSYLPGWKRLRLLFVISGVILLKIYVILKKRK